MNLWARCGNERKYLTSLANQEIKWQQKFRRKEG